MQKMTVIYYVPSALMPSLRPPCSSQKRSVCLIVTDSIDHSNVHIPTAIICVPLLVRILSVLCAQERLRHRVFGEDIPRRAKSA